jgi:hypothetical protein
VRGYDALAVLVYFDESYDSDKDFLLLGALFNPKPKAIHSNMVKVKRNLRYLGTQGQLLEIKYATSNNRRRYVVARE